MIKRKVIFPARLFSLAKMFVKYLTKYQNIGDMTFSVAQVFLLLLLSGLSLVWHSETWTHLCLRGPAVPSTPGRDTLASWPWNIVACWHVCRMCVCVRGGGKGAGFSIHTHPHTNTSALLPVKRVARKVVKGQGWKKTKKHWKTQQEGTLWTEDRVLKETHDRGPWNGLKPTLWSSALHSQKCYLLVFLLSLCKLGAWAEWGP